MNNAFKSTKVLAAIALFGCSIVFIAWQKADIPNRQNRNEQREIRDTSRPKRTDAAANEYRVDEIEKALRNLDKELQKMDIELKRIDVSKIEKEVNEALSKVDFDKIKAETDQSIKNIDWKKINYDINKSVAEATASMKEMKSEKLQKEMANLQEELKEENFHIKINAEKIHDEVEQGLKKAAAELKSFHEFTDALEKDGLIDKKKGYTIKVKSGLLIINGHQQSNDVYEKYKQYYKKDHFTLNSDGETISSL